MTTLQLLALMVSMLTPGGSTYSQTVVPRDAVTVCPPHLSPMSPLCRAPRFNPSWRAWTRAETRSEALVRWRVIAEQIEAVASRPPKGWRGSPDLLARYLLAISRNESGWRKDVHAGIGKRSRGDCTASGSCRSVCLVQILKPRAHWKSARGYSHRSLAGLSAAATRRCFETAADYLANASARVCGQAMRPACLFGAYGGGVPAKDPRIRARVATLLATYRSVPALSESDREVVGL